MSDELYSMEGAKFRMTGILLGYSMPKGDPVYLEEAHTLVSGMTRKAGKTTTIAGVLSRWQNKTALVFITKRGERGKGLFEGGNAVRPFYRTPSGEALWRYIESMIEITLEGEKQRQERPLIVKVCRGVRPESDDALQQVWNNVKSLLNNRRIRTGWERSHLELLDEYMKMVVPEIQKLQLSKLLRLEGDKLNVMDLSDYEQNIQAMIIGATVEEINKRWENVLVVIAEAWEVIPNGKASPAKGALIALAKKGAVLGNYLIIDSQTIADIEPAVRKQVGNYILGKQPDEIESARVIDLIPVPPSEKPRAYEVQTLGLGEYYAVIDGKVNRAYACPAWMELEVAQRIAKGLTDKPVAIVHLTEVQKDEQDTSRGVSNARGDWDAHGAEPPIMARDHKLSSGGLGIPEHLRILEKDNDSLEFVKELRAENEAMRNQLKAFEGMRDFIRGLVKEAVEMYAPVRQSASVQIEQDADLKVVMEPPAQLTYDEKTTIGKVLAIIRMGAFDSAPLGKADIHRELLKHYNVDKTAARFYKVALDDALDTLMRRPLSVLKQEGALWGLTERGQQWRQSK